MAASETHVYLPTESPGHKVDRRTALKVGDVPGLNSNEPATQAVISLCDFGDWQRGIPRFIFKVNIQKK
jgi:hypothetical protein